MSFKIIMQYYYRIKTRTTSRTESTLKQKTIKITFDGLLYIEGFNLKPINPIQTMEINLTLCLMLKPQLLPHR